MPPGAKAKAAAAKAAAARAKGKAKAKAEPKATARGKAAAAAAETTPKKRGAEAASPAPPSKKRSGEAASSTVSPAPKGKASSLKKSTSSAALEKAKAAAVTGGKKKAGGRTVDSRVPLPNLKVVDDYAVKLNQTNVDGNNNKYYIIQVLEGDGKYYAWNRWGRVGEDGQNKLLPCSSEAQAIKEFEKKFREKTKNAWGNRDSFKTIPGQYTLVETEDAAGGGQDQAPMGKLTEAQIGKGQVVLDKLQAELDGSGDASELARLSSEFYSLVPHNFGRSRPPAITTHDMLEAKVELLKFYLRMGFEEVEEEVDTGRTPVSGVMVLPCPKTLDDACTGVCGKGPIKSSNTKGEQLAKKQVGAPVRKMSAAEYAAIMLYTSNAIYKDLNQCLRDENRTKLKKYFKYLRLFFESMESLPKQKRTLWRGMSVDLHSNPQYQVGNTVTWWGISSCTSDVNVAKGFAKGCGGKCTIITLESETASDISQITFYSNEKESLLCPGTQLKVKSNKMNGNVCEITLKEVGRVIG